MEYHCILSDDIDLKIPWKKIKLFFHKISEL